MGDAREREQNSFDFITRTSIPHLFLVVMYVVIQVSTCLIASLSSCARRMWKIPNPAVRLFMTVFFLLEIQHSYLPAGPDAGRQALVERRILKRVSGRIKLRLGRNKSSQRALKSLAQQRMALVETDLEMDQTIRRPGVSLSLSAVLSLVSSLCRALIGLAVQVRKSCTA